MTRLAAWVRRRPFPCYYAAAAAATLAWAAVFHLDFGAAVVADESPGDVRYSLSGGVLSVFGEDGRRLYEIRTGRLDHEDGSDHLGFDESDMRYQTDGGMMLITSGEGRFFPGDEALVFDERVRVRRMSEGRVAEELETQALTVVANEQRAHGDEYAVIRRRGSVISGDGVEIDLESGKLKLLNNVRMK